MKKTLLALMLAAILPAQAMALQINDVLSLVAMPLTVAAVGDLAGVPQDQLANLVASLNNGGVPPVQFVEVMRYVPVALVADNSQPAFVTFVQNQTAQGVTGVALVTAIRQQLRQYGVTAPQLTVIASAWRPPVVDQDYFPPVVRKRLAEARGNPHGGPPGQLKKIYGVQTGAEVVHGEKPGRQAGVGMPQTAGRPSAGHGREDGGIPPGQAKKIEGGGPGGSPGGVPPGQAKKHRGGGEGHPQGHGKD